MSSNGKRQGRRRKRRIPVDTAAPPVRGAHALEHEEPTEASPRDDARWMLEEARADADKLARALASLRRRIDAAAELLGEVEGAEEAPDVSEAPEPLEAGGLAAAESGTPGRRRFVRDPDHESEGLRGAHMVAVQMALAGRGREQVAERLKSSLKSDELEPMLDDVFGDPRVTG